MFVWKETSRVVQIEKNYIRNNRKIKIFNNHQWSEPSLLISFLTALNDLCVALSLNELDLCSQSIQPANILPYQLWNNTKLVQFQYTLKYNKPHQEYWKLNKTIKYQYLYWHRSLVLKSLSSYYYKKIFNINKNSLWILKSIFINI